MSNEELGIQALLGITGFVVWALGMAYFAYWRHQRGGDLPDGVASFGAYFPRYLKEHPIALVVGLTASFFGGFTVGIVAWFITRYLRWLMPWNWFGQGNKIKFESERNLKRKADEATRQWLLALGPTHEARIPAIEEMFQERTKTLPVSYHGTWKYQDPERNNRYKDAYLWTEVTRNLAAMDNRERNVLRLVELLNSAADGKNETYLAWRFALAWGQGKGTQGGGQWHLGVNQEDAKTPRQALDLAVERKHLEVEPTISAVLAHVESLRNNPSGPLALRAIVNDAAETLTGGGSSWLRPADVGRTPFAPSGDYPLRIGSFPDGTALNYSGDGSMVTIAPPGSGKTQCNVFPNLLSWRGPAVVLDISGDIYEQTSKWRADHVGPVYRFSPLEPELSSHYNPLSFVRSDPDFLWEDARLLAEMMIVPGITSDPFWENEARTVLTAAIANACYSNPPERRPMHEVLDVMYGGQAWDDMLLGLRSAVDVRVMQQHANALATMQEKTLSSVLQTARSSLSAWTGERIARVTDRSDWSPNDLRGTATPTIYICVRPNEVESYLSLLRVFIGQHIRMLTGGEVPPHGSPPILIMLDELPRLREMPPVDEALNIGRKYGLRLWMFAQSVGQLQNAYKNADGMLGSCAVRIFMNPSGADGLADKLSDELGYVDSINDGNRKKLAEGSELSGPGFRDQQIVLALGTRPARVKKDFAWQNAELAGRMGSAPTPMSRSAQ